MLQNLNIEFLIALDIVSGFDRLFDFLHDLDKVRLLRVQNVANIRKYFDLLRIDIQSFGADLLFFLVLVISVHIFEVDRWWTHTPAISLVIALD